MTQNQTATAELPPVAEFRLFIGVFCTGITYADRHVQKAGDYARLGFLPFDTLQLKIEPDCPLDLRSQIEAHAATMQARRGDQYQVSTSGQTVMLGSALQKAA